LGGYEKVMPLFNLQ